MTKKPEYNIGLSPLNLPSPLTAADGWEQSFTQGKKVEVDSAILGALQAQRHAASAWSALDQVRRSKDPKSTAAGHLGRVEELTKKTVNSVKARAASAEQQIQLRVEAINRGISDRLLTPSSDAQEIRSVIRGLPPEQRYEAITAAVNGGDVITTSAILAGQPITTGLSDKEFSSIRRMAENKLCKEQVEQRSELQRAQKLMKDVQASTIEIAEEAAGSPLARKQFLEDSNRAAEAEAALAGLVQATDLTGWDSLKN